MQWNSDMVPPRKPDDWLEDLQTRGFNLKAQSAFKLVCCMCSLMFEVRARVCTYLLLVHKSQAGVLSHSGCCSGSSIDYHTIPPVNWLKAVTSAFVEESGMFKELSFWLEKQPLLCFNVIHDASRTFFGNKKTFEIATRSSVTDDLYTGR